MFFSVFGKVWADEVCRRASPTASDSVRFWEKYGQMPLGELGIGCALTVLGKSLPLGLGFRHASPTSPPPSLPSDSAVFGPDTILKAASHTTTERKNSNHPLHQHKPPLSYNTLTTSSIKTAMTEKQIPESATEETDKLVRARI